MILNQQFAQKFVDSIMGNIGYNVNIMNQQGIIIASGSKERIGSFHKIALEVIKLQKRIDVNDAHLDGVKIGINMPFYFNNKMAGVIGITGEPNILENIASMVKMMAEIMLEQEYLKERVYFSQNQNTFFINKLLSENSEDNYPEIYRWSEKSGYNMDFPRCVCLIAAKIPPKIKDPLIRKENINHMILSEIKSLKSSDPQDIFSENDIDKIIILKKLNSLSEFTSQKLKNYLDDITSAVHTKYGLDLMIGVGSPYPEPIKNLRTSYTEAQAMLELATKSNCKNEAFFVTDHISEYLFYQTPPDRLQHFLAPYCNKLRENTELKETVQCLIRNNMNIVSTSKQLHLHRNTVVFRLEKLKDMFRINPLHNSRDRTLLEMIDLYLTFYS